MTTTTNNLPGTAANVNVTGTAWVNINNIKAVDGAVATSGDLDDGITTDYALATNFGFSVPTGATIVGVTVQINCYTDRVFDGSFVPGGIFANLYNNLTIGSQKQDYSNMGAGSLATVTFGSGSDRWGATLTPAIVNASTFGVAVQAYGNGIGDVAPYFAYIDYVKMQVTYSLGLGNKNVLLLGIG